MQGCIPEDPNCFQTAFDKNCMLWAAYSAVKGSFVAALQHLWAARCHLFHVLGSALYVPSLGPPGTSGCPIHPQPPARSQSSPEPSATALRACEGWGGCLKPLHQEGDKRIFIEEIGGLKNSFQDFFSLLFLFLSKLPNLSQRAGCLHLSHIHTMLYLYIILTSKGKCDIFLAVQERKDTDCFWERSSY